MGGSLFEILGGATLRRSRFRPAAFLLRLVGPLPESLGPRTHFLFLVLFGKEKKVGLRQ